MDHCQRCECVLRRARTDPNGGLSLRRFLRGQCLGGAQSGPENGARKAHCHHSAGQHSKLHVNLSFKFFTFIQTFRNEFHLKTLGANSSTMIGCGRKDSPWNRRCKMPYPNPSESVFLDNYNLVDPHKSIIHLQCISVIFITTLKLCCRVDYLLYIDL